MKFNKQQLEAINYKEGACAVIAGAGSGKSTVMIERIHKLIESGVDGDEILAISFTHNTAEELKKKLNNKGIYDVHTGTFHAICKRILESEGISTQNELLPFVIKDTFRKIYGGNVKFNEIMSFISYQKQYNRGYNDEFVSKDSSYTIEELRRFYKAYEQLKTDKKVLDLDDWLVITDEILTNNPNKYTYKYLLVDEHQDSNLIQNDLIKKLCPSGNIFCVFDYRQAIYTFRGGNPEYCMNFKKYYPNAKIINLDINYRSNNNIVQNANHFIKEYYGDYEYYSDGLSSNNRDGNIEIISNDSKQEEAIHIVDNIENLIKNGVKPESIAVLYRLNSNSEFIESELKARKIKYYIDDKSNFFKRKEIEGVLSVLRLVHNQNDDEAFRNIFLLRTNPIGFMKTSVLEDIERYAALHGLSLYKASQLIRYSAVWQRQHMNKFDRSINNLIIQYRNSGDLTKLIDNIVIIFELKEWIENNYEDEEEIEDKIKSFETLKLFVRKNTLESFISYAYNTNKNQRKNNKDCVQLMTIHKSKGLEFDNVFVAGIEDDKFPHKKSELNDEARLFYVAITRAKKNLYLSQIYDDNLFINQYIA